MPNRTTPHDSKQCDAQIYSRSLPSHTYCCSLPADHRSAHYDKTDSSWWTDKDHPWHEIEKIK